MQEDFIKLAKDFIMYFEGIELKSYQDSGGVWTIGIGHTKDVYEGQEIDEDEATEFFKEDLFNALERVKQIVSVEVDCHQYAALVSQAFNLRSFERLANYLNTSEELYKNKMLLYVKDIKGNKLPGLMIRRISERLLFEHKDWKLYAGLLQENPTVKNILETQNEIFSS